MQKRALVIFLWAALMWLATGCGKFQESVLSFNRVETLRDVYQRVAEICEKEDWPSTDIDVRDMGDYWIARTNATVDMDHAIIHIHKKTGRILKKELVQSSFAKRRSR